MIVVRVELWSAITGKITTLGTAVISNDGTAPDSMTGNYDVRLGKFDKEPEDVLKLKSNCWKVGRVEGFPRQRLGPWDLLYRALKPLVRERNP